MAKNTSLYFRIVEGRNLPAKDVSGTSDPYCIVKVDNEVVARTATVWKNLNPFWGEEYTLHLPMGFHSLSFYVMDEDTIGHDDVIGKISLNKEAIGSQGKGLDNWMNLTRVDPDEEVQGEIHLGLELLRDPPRTGLRCHVIEARDLAPRDISGSSDPFARILFNNRTAETSIIKKTRFPHWDEVLELELEGSEEAEGRSLTLEVWDWDLVGKNDFLGKVEIPLECLQRTPQVRGWFRLLPLGNMEDDAGGKLGALRLTIRLAEDRILPSMYYQPLIDLLVESVICPAKVEDTTPLTMLEEVTTVESRQDVAMTLVKIYLGQGLVVPFLDYLNMKEVNQTSDPNTLFRSNSLASKAMEQFMKVCSCLHLYRQGAPEKKNNTLLRITNISPELLPSTALFSALQPSPLTMGTETLHSHLCSTVIALHNTENQSKHSILISAALSLPCTILRTSLNTPFSSLQHCHCPAQY
ncbi:rasGAP-activating-like protein 1 isoform X2 [Acipenser oxyrinchus oxyrinchus]|uniref:RasGAP-activating-like protein 1 isoform X2 n=1 Tax=Acipenser oxyrinchus oxyrinchus TaxID=40147 RepID=A0AAD8CWD1_ACIOX|nr:rasGAP-activating-like protein 1 isoform X2 [Acipenser oxyrinchus oxyrinchus]